MTKKGIIYIAATSGSTGPNNSDEKTITSTLLRLPSMTAPANWSSTGPLRKNSMPTTQ